MKKWERDLEKRRDEEMGERFGEEKKRRRGEERKRESSLRLRKGKRVKYERRERENIYIYSPIKPQDPTIEKNNQETNQMDLNNQKTPSETEIGRAHV